MKLDHNNNFDLIRLLAALQVVQFHSAELVIGVHTHWLAFILAQFPGVTVFFVVSGFLITRSYLQGSGGVLAYFARRGLRIYPALCVTIGLLVLLLAATGSISPHLTAGRLVAWLATSFVMGSQICGDYLVGTITRPNGFYQQFPLGVTWTIVVELGFYALLPVILMGKFRDKRFAWISLIGWAALSLFVMSYYFRLKTAAPDATLTKLLSINPLTDLWEFLIGASLSIYWTSVRRLFEGKFLWWFAIYMAFAVFQTEHFGVSMLNSHADTPLMPLRVAVLAGVVISFAFTWRTAASFLRGNDFSYGIYLWHLPLLVTMNKLGFVGSNALWVVVFGATFGLAALSWFLVERPVLRLKARADQWFGDIPGRRLTRSLS